MGYVLTPSMISCINPTHCCT